MLTDLLSDSFDGLATLARMPVGDYLPAAGVGEPQTRQATLEMLNFQILTALTDMQPALQLAYQLGRSLRDTANPPLKLEAAADAKTQVATGGAKAAEAASGPPEDVTIKILAEQLDHGRIAKLQEWLATLSPEFPKLTAAVVAGSLGRWSDLAAVTVGANTTTRQARTGRLGQPKLPEQHKQTQIAKSMRMYLLPQGDVWLMLLTGELATSGLLTPEGYVTAGEAALRRSGKIIRGILRHYWFGVLCVVAALGFTLFLAATYLHGGSKVWTSIAAIVSALGVSGQTIASKSARLTAEAAQPVLAMADEDAMAWAITTLPPLDLTFTGVRHLRRAGVAPTASLSRF